MHLFRLAAILTGIVMPLVAESQPTALPGTREPVEATIIEVVPLTYARAGELAYTLSLVAPARVRIVPYYPNRGAVHDPS